MENDITYLGSSYKQQIERMEKLGINTTGQTFEQMVYTLLLMVEKDYNKNTESKIEAYKTLLSAAFDIKMNANDFFHYACAQMVTIVSEDVWWVIEHIEKYGDEGVNSAMAYIQNDEPLPPHRTDGFNEAIKELVDRKQEVHGDIDWEFHYYNDKGPYRKINEEWL